MVQFGRVTSHVIRRGQCVGGVIVDAKGRDILFVPEACEHAIIPPLFSTVSFVLYRDDETNRLFADLIKVDQLPKEAPLKPWVYSRD